MEVLDVGTGRGRLALALAPHCRRVVGIDIDAAAIEEARRRAAAAGLGNVQFVVADAEQVDFVEPVPGTVPIHPDLVVAHLYLSRALVEKSSAALGPGGVLAFVGFHADQWRETGRRSRFAWDEDAIRDLLEVHRFRIDHLEVDTEVTSFGSLEEALAAVVALQDRWRQDGRWFRYVQYLEQGGRQLTRSHLVVKARRR
jgi:SAM-dependent methyltransferase